VGGGKFFEHFLALRGQRQIGPPPVGWIFLAANQFFGGEPICQSHGALVPDLQPFGQLADGNAVAPGEPFDGQQSLMLLWRETNGVRRFFAEAQKLPQPLAQRGQRLVLPFGDLCHACRPYSGGKVDQIQP
jgi:hypothetical protein